MDDDSLQAKRARKRKALEEEMERQRAEEERMRKELEERAAQTQRIREQLDRLSDMDSDELEDLSVPSPNLSRLNNSLTIAIVSFRCLADHADHGSDPHLPAEHSRRGRC